MKIKNDLVLYDNPTTIKLHKNKEKDDNFSIDYDSRDLDDFNKYNIKLNGDIGDIHELADTLRDIADYLDNTIESITKIDIEYKRG